MMKLLSIFGFQNLKQTTGFVASKIWNTILDSGAPLLDSSHERFENSLLNYTVLPVLGIHQPFYISICISTLPTQYTTFI